MSRYFWLRWSIKRVTAKLVVRGFVWERVKLALLLRVKFGFKKIFNVKLNGHLEGPKAEGTM